MAELMLLLSLTNRFATRSNIGYDFDIMCRSIAFSEEVASVSVLKSLEKK